MCSYEINEFVGFTLSLEKSHNFVVDKMPVNDEHSGFC